MKELSEFTLKLISYIGELGVVLSILIVLWHYYRLTTFKNLVKRYEYANTWEVKTLKTAATIFSIAIGFFFFDMISIIMGKIAGYEYAFIAFVSLGITVIFGYSLSQYFKVYYPFIMEKRLSKIRFSPRISPKTGKPMKLLSEKEEDAHLTQEMIDNENAFTYDYDVWIDEETGYKLIERYDGHLHSLICPNCDFRTMKDYKEDIIESPSQFNKGVLKKYFKCSHCGHEEIKTVQIASLEDEKELELIS